MEVHGVECGVQLAMVNFDNFEPSDCNEAFLNKRNDANQPKRYKCRQCPYVSNSKTQFLYHKQFHRPRDAPFKCMYCSYNVSRRHLLYQHLRVHDTSQEQNNSEQQSSSDSPVDPIPAPEIDTADMPEIPLVWVFKSGNFQKMFKCRWCPHVNVRKINIQEHEKMHRPEGKNSSNSQQQPSFKLQCPDCNYMCKNAGVLSSHLKVHQGFYGEIRSLVDPTKTDAEQVQALQKAIRIVEPEVVISVDGDTKEECKESNEKDQSPQPESVYNQSSSHDQNRDHNDDTRKIISFCSKCPARFFLKRELRIHSKFHLIRSPFGCPYCSYAARQRPHLLSHYKVHSQEYQQRTAELVNSYAVSTENPRQKTVIITKTSDVIDGPVWMLENCNSEKKRDENKLESKKKYSDRTKYSCSRCPAKFIKFVALQYHRTLHGGSHQHKCKYCDYAVKTYGNLVRHQLVHEEGEKRKALKASLSESPRIKSESGSESPPMKFKPKLELNKKKTDPQFGTLMHGSPEFIYPTYLKNGKIKEKRYKCHKCPSAFEKRDQYRIHLSLHGSKQKYRCEKCDYSVKYYANYVQHMRKHQSHDEALEARKSKEFEDEPEESSPTEQAPPEEECVLYDEKNPEQAYPLTLLEQQTLLLQEMKKQTEKDDDRKMYWCAYCPYVSNRRDAVDNHTRRHYCVSGIRSTFKCMHCDYSASQANFLREHNKLHFSKSSRHKPDAYLKCEKMELWCIEEKGTDDQRSEVRTLVFKDKGENCEDRFFPPIPAHLYQSDEDDWKIYVNPETGEPIAESDLEPNPENDVVMEYEADDPLPPQLETGNLGNEELLEMVEEQLGELPHEDLVITPKPKVKRWRGKNWQCKKCPHAFGKKDQYLRHVSLHGSNQRHNCDICDYSVKYYTNYVQHMRMHQMYEPDKVIYVKKNAQSLEESVMKMAKEAETHPDLELFINNMGEVEGYESDSVMSRGDEKMAVDCCEDTDREYSSLSDATEVSMSSEEGMRENSVGMEGDVGEFVDDENISSIIS
ncbi:UNVERIFIED_CONTAM: hypothetical protein PYX00_006270 [Menopon gallinae]